MYAPIASLMRIGESTEDESQCETIEDVTIMDAKKININGEKNTDFSEVEFFVDGSMLSALSVSKNPYSTTEISSPSHNLDRANSAIYVSPLSGPAISEHDIGNESPSYSSPQHSGLIRGPSLPVHGENSSPARSPDYVQTLPKCHPASPVTQLRENLMSPKHDPTTPAYNPTSPPYRPKIPTSPEYNPTSPVHIPTSPVYIPASLRHMHITRKRPCIITNLYLNLTKKWSKVQSAITIVCPINPKVLS